MEHAGKELKHCSKFEFIIEVYLLRGENTAAFRISSHGNFHILRMLGTKTFRPRMIVNLARAALWINVICTDTCCMFRKHFDRNNQVGSNSSSYKHSKTKMY